MIDFIIQSAGAVLLFIGLWLTGNVRLRGPAICMLAECFTLTTGIRHHTWSMWFIGLVLFFVQLRTFIKWKREGASW